MVVLSRVVLLGLALLSVPVLVQANLVVSLMDGLVAFLPFIILSEILAAYALMRWYGYRVSPFKVIAVLFFANIITTIVGMMLPFRLTAPSLVIYTGLFVLFVVSTLVEWGILAVFFRSEPTTRQLLIISTFMNLISYVPISIAFLAGA